MVETVAWQGGSGEKNEGNRSSIEGVMVETVAHGSGSGSGTVAGWQ
jgi:hypothetical protein